MKKYWLFIFVLGPLVWAQPVLSEREQARVKDELLGERLTQLLPELMDRTGIDMWVMITREYNEDPVVKTLLPATWLNARRRTMILFYRNADTQTMDRLAVARYAFGPHIASAWDAEKQPDQWKRLVELISERNPKKIGINVSEDFNIADGLDHTDYALLMDYLPEQLRTKVVSAQPLATAWIETRTEREMQIYTQLSDLTHKIIAQAFSEQVITPGITTTTDVEWWFREELTRLGLETWFHPSVDVQRSEDVLGDHLYSFANRPEHQVIQHGDLLHCDFGITYLGLNTDCQELAYVLHPSETSPPAYLVKALAQGNQLQDFLTDEFKTGRTGNEILAQALKNAKKSGLRPSIYTHPLGSYGHSSGPTIGMWDQQDGVPGAGDYPLFPRTVYAIELNTTVYIPEWKRDIRIMLEEPGYFGPEGFRYVHGRQTQLLTIPRVQEHQGY
ncbi:MAG: M24 family metallopeptidase [Flavobacteriaceae bacterium]